jgi:error-prone DNA polymerase
MFVHLHVHSPFSFLDGASSIEDLVAAAAACDMPALAVTDHDNLSAAVGFHQACAAAGIKPITGAEVTLEGGHHLTLLAQDPSGYANLCRILTQAHLGQPRLHPAASLDALREHNAGIIALSGCMRGEVPSLIRRRRVAAAEQAARRYRDIFGDRFFLEMQNLLLPAGASLNRRLAELAQHLGVGVVATNNVHHRTRADFPVHDLLTCARTLTRLDDVHPARRLNAHCYLRSEREMREFFRDHPQAVETAGRIAEMCAPALRPGKYRFPAYPGLAGETADAMLQRLAEQGARRLYGRINAAVAQRLRHELSVIRQLGFADYFLAVWDLAQFARRRGIRYAGRGSAADSLVAYCLGLTGVDPVARGLLFERFMSLERAVPPDIDIDFAAERRDEVTDYVIARYGAEHVAAVATYNTFRARSAVRDLGQAMGFPPEDLDHLARHLPYLAADAIAEAFDAVPELRDSGLPRARYRKLLDICQAVAGFPRHLSTHLGGLVITGDPVTNLSPLQMAAKGLPVIHFDKDDIEDLGLVKLDLLCLRMLSAVDDAARAIRTRDASFDYDAIPDDDRATYDLIAATETVGMFQLESPAQRALHARLQPERFEDLVAAVALIRPGPILADMVEPYLERRAGRAPVIYLHPALERILAKTYGVVLFQEQVIEIAIAIGGFTPGEADRLRRAMTHHRSWEEMERIGEQFIARAVARGARDEVAREIFSYIRAYAGYGFCEAHAAAFADTAYKTAYLKAHYPAEFYAALLSHQPMGFYPPNTLVWEAKRCGIPVLGPDINRSAAGFTVERGTPTARGVPPAHGSRAIRMGLVQIRGMGEGSLRTMLDARQAGPFRSLEDFRRRVAIDRDLARNMILCGAFDALCPNRREALWDLDATLSSAGLTGNLSPVEQPEAKNPLPHCASDLADSIPGRGFFIPPRGIQNDMRRHGDSEPFECAQGILPSSAPSSTHAPDFSPREKWRYEFDILDFALRAHPVGLIRERLRRQGVITTAAARRGRSGRRVKVTGLIIRPHRPPTKSGRTVVFFTLEDETGMLDVTVFDAVYQRCGKAIFTQPIVTVSGRLDRRGDATAPAALIADSVA